MQSVGLCGDGAGRESDKRSRYREVNCLEFMSSLSSLAASRPGDCFRSVLFAVGGLVCDGGLWRSDGRDCDKCVWC